MLHLEVTDVNKLDHCQSLAEEFTVLKDVYVAKILKEHPDKGGSPEDFRQTRAAFFVLRELYQNHKVKNDTFTSYLLKTRQTKKKKTTKTSSSSSSEDDEESTFAYSTFYQDDGDIPSYEYFQRAAEEAVPGYKVELAKTGVRVFEQECV